MTTPSDPHQPPGAHYGQHPPTGGLPAADDYSPQPPTKPKTTVIVSIVAVVVLVLGTLGITGFVAPGFFLSDDKETTAAPVAEKTVESTEPAEPSEDASSPEIVADRIIMALKKGDVGALENLMCPDAKEKLKGVVGETDADSVDLVGEIRQVNEDEAKFDMTLTMSGAPFSAYARLAKLGGEWCWGGMTIVPAQESDVKAERPSTPEIPGMPTEADALEAGRKLAKQLVDKINNGDAAGTRALFCDGDNRLVENIMKWQPKIVMGETTADSGMKASTDLIGSRSDEPNAKGFVSVTFDLPEDSWDLSKGTWCVDGFHFY